MSELDPKEDSKGKDDREMSGLPMSKSRIRRDSFENARANVPFASERPVPSVDSGVSGRRFVILAIAGFLLLTATLSWQFQTWRAQYVARVAYGERVLVSTLEPLRAILPDETPDGDQPAWNAKISETEAMLRSLVASNLLDRDELEHLGADLRSRVARSQPSSVRHDLAAIWTEILKKGGPSLQKRHPRPEGLAL